jgi:hypothetical protein
MEGVGKVYERFKQILSENVCSDESVIIKWVLEK